MRFATIRRFVLALLIALLPMQLSWAVVGEYCGHESGRATHLGHHEHQHVSAADDQASGKLPDGAHPDCGVCHAGHAVFASVLPAHAAASASAGVAAHHPARIAAHPASEPEKPKWLRLA